jgi:AraC-like DNA-binding protein
MLASIALFLMQVPYYVLACRRVLRAHSGETFSWFARLESKPLDTLRVLVLLLGVNWLVGLLRTLHCLILGKDTGLGVAFAAIEVTGTLWAIFTMLGAHLTSNGPVLATTVDAGPSREPKYAKSSLDAATRSRIKRKIHEALATRRLHCHSDLSLRRLCEHLRENPHYVSQVINQDLASSFNDLINRQRIEDAKRALTESPDRTVLSICLDMGFNSKSTFNAAFRQHTGMTPSEYRSRYASGRAT